MREADRSNPAFEACGQTFPQVRGTYYAHHKAAVIGNVVLGDKVSVFPNATIRADGGIIELGEGANVQDGAVIHNVIGGGPGSPGHETHVGRYVTIGHGAILHGCDIGEDTLVGMGAIVLSGAVVGKNCIIGAGAVVTEGKSIPDNSLVLGCPGKVLRQTTDADKVANHTNALHYIELAGL